MATYHEGCAPWKVADQHDGGLELLSPQERDVVVGVVLALVNRAWPVSSE